MNTENKQAILTYAKEHQLEIEHLDLDLLFTLTGQIADKKSSSRETVNLDLDAYMTNVTAKDLETFYAKAFAIVHPEMEINHLHIDHLEMWAADLKSDIQAFSAIQSIIIGNVIRSQTE